MKRAIATVLVLFSTLIAWPSVAQIAISVSFGPPPLPVYAQPLCPEDGYLWTPGYWAYDNYFGYYWIPGTWVLAPQPGLLWTPGWWGWSEGAFLFHEGYWASHVGFYGGINYGFGFFGDGYAGGRWNGDHFYYNRAVSNINVTTIHNVYNTTVVNNITVNHVSYNGGNGGIDARPTHEEEEVAQQHHVAIQPVQLRHLQMARADPRLRAEVNHGKPAIAATARPAAFTGSHVVAAREAGGAYQAPERKLDHASSVPAHQVPSPLREVKPTQQESHEAEPGSQAHQQQERALVDRQNQQHAQLQAQQEREHEQAQQHNLSEQRQQEMEQRHAQQTAQMEQQHMQQMQRVQRPQAPSRPSEPAHPDPKPPHH
jgi:Skp family chaperone for outer membrane proteins